MCSLHYICRVNAINDIEQEKKTKLLRDVVSIFMTYGIKSVTMDDVAKQLHISKKTLYQYVSDKNDLVLQCVQLECRHEECEIGKILAQNLNAIDENIAISRFVLGQIRDVHPSIFYDFEKYHPEALAMLNESRQGFTVNVIYNNITKGINEGYFRNDIHVEIATRLWLSRINAIFQPVLFPMKEFTLSEVYQQMFVQQIRGLATEKGLKYFENRIEPNLKTTQP